MLACLQMQKVQMKKVPIKKVPMKKVPMKEMQGTPACHWGTAELHLQGQLLAAATLRSAGQLQRAS